MMKLNATNVPWGSICVKNMESTSDFDIARGGMHQVLENTNDIIPLHGQDTQTKAHCKKMHVSVATSYNAPSYIRSR